MRGVCALGWILASHLWSIPPFQRLAFPRPKNKNSGRKLLFLKSVGQNIFSDVFFGIFVTAISILAKKQAISPVSALKIKKTRPKLRRGRSVKILSLQCECPISTFVNNKHSCSKSGKNQAKIACFCSSGGNFVTTILSHYSRPSQTTSDLTRLTRPRSLDCDSGRDRQMKTFLVFAHFFVSTSPNSFFAPTI